MRLLKKFLRNIKLGILTDIKRKYANHKNNLTIGITGFDGGHLRKIARHSVNVNVNNMQITEDLHMIITHLIMTVLNNHISNDNKVWTEEYV